MNTETSPKPVAWRTFDGEGEYDYMSYEGNERYREDYITRNGEKYAHWVEPLFASPQGAPSPAARDVLAERERQKTVEGWTPEHDDAHSNGELALAAGKYAGAAGGWTSLVGWPWAQEWWKPGTPRSNLVKAGALILAEIERLDRAAMKGQPS